MSEAAPSKPLPYGMQPNAAQRRIEVFRKRFGDAHLYLAYHAALPLALTPDLLYRLRANFPCDVHNEELNIPWIAVADLLLSSLCSEVGYELYEMDVAVRAELLNQLRANPKFGFQRLTDVSNFLRKYVHQQLDNPNPAIRKFAQAQEWTALAATRPEEAAHSIALTLSILDPSDKAELARMASLLESFTISSDGFTQLLTYVRGMEYYARGDEENARVELSKLTEQNQSIEVFGVALPLPKDMHEETWVEQEENHIYRRNFFISYHKTDRIWAEWITWQLEEVGYSTLLQAWDFHPSINFEAEMDKAIKAAERIIVILSHEYLKVFSTVSVWKAAFSQISEGRKSILLPIRVDDCDTKVWLEPIVYIDLAGLDELEAQAQLLSFVHSMSSETVFLSFFSDTFQRSVPEKPLFPKLPTSASSKKPIEILFSYSREDEALRDKLEKHLSSMKRQNRIVCWHDRNIRAGNSWNKTISTHLDTAQIILLLVSADFLDSDYCNSVEVKRALQRHQKGEARVIPIILRKCDWHNEKFAALQALPRDAKPVVNWSNQDDALYDVAIGIKKLVEEFEKEQTTKPFASPSLWNIPLRRNLYFTDREGILKKIHDTFTAGKTVAPSQAISGLGGIGKTQIAIEYAYRYRDDYQAVLWAKSDTREVLFSEFVSIAHLLKLPERVKTDQNTIVRAVIRWLRDNADWLFILDNVENLKVLHEFLPPEGKGHILLTTRSYSVDGIAQLIEIGELEPEQGALFLLRRAKIIRVDASLSNASEADSSKAKEISRALGGLPLALDQAGAYIEETGCQLDRFLQLYQTQHDAQLKRLGRLILEHPDVTIILSNLAMLYSDQHKYNQAEQLFIQVLAIREWALGPDHIDVAASLDDLARLYIDQGKYEQAEILYQRVLAINEQLFGPEHPNVITSINNLSGLYLAQNKSDQSNTLLATLKARYFDSAEHGLQIDKSSRQVWVDGQLLPQKLSVDECKLLLFLASRNGEICSRAETVSAVYGASYETELDDGRLDALVGHTRKKIGDNPRSPRFLETIYKLGFRLSGFKG